MTVNQISLKQSKYNNVRKMSFVRAIFIKKNGDQERQKWKDEN